MFQKFRSPLALLLACSLLLTCLPAPALAAEWTQTQSATEESTPEEETFATEESAPEEETSASEESTPEEEPSTVEEETPSGDAAQDAPVETTWTTVTDATEVARLVRNNWSDSYFQEAVVDTRRNRVTVDGEQADFDQVFDGVTEDEAEEILTSADAVEAYFEDTAYEAEVQSDGTVSVTAPYQTCRILLTAEDLDEDYGAETILEYSAYDEYVLQFATEEDTQAAYAQLAARYGAENCLVDQVITADELFLSDGEDETTSDTYSWGCSYMGLDTLKASADADAETVTVAIIDSGIDADHAYFEGRTITADSYDFLAAADEDPTELSDPYGHGTHVAGIIVECTPDNVELMVLRILDDSGNSSLALVKTAMQYALEHGADVMNLSLGVSGAYTYLDSIIQTVYDAGILVCCAAGNSSSNDVYYPASNAQTVAVSGINSDGSFANSYSNYGEEIDFCAPGTSIVSAASGGGTTSKSGTSMASAHVAAALTYVIAACPDATAEEQYSVLQSCVTDLGDTGKDAYYGWGCVTNLAGMFDLSGLETQVTLSQTAYTYDGTAKEPEVTVQCGGLTLTQGDDYTVTYSDNVAVGTATVTVTGAGDYTGTVETTFVIAVADLSACTVTLSPTSYTYDGTAKEPAVTVTDEAGDLLTEGADYTVAYSNNIAVGTATVTVTGTGSFIGSATATFAIAAADLSACTVTVADAVYTGNALTPTVTVTDEAGNLLTEDTDYIVDCQENMVAVGTYTVTVTGTGNFTGVATATFAIAAADLSACTVTLSATSYTYDGSAKKPTVTVKDADGNTLTSGTDYTVTYFNNTNAGTATVTVTGKGNYTGTVAKTFSITYATPTLSGVSNTTSGVKVTWKAVTGAAKYRVFRKTGSGSWTQIADTTSTSYADTTAKSGTTYKYTVRCVNSAGTSYTSSYDSTGLSIKYLTAGKIASLTNTSSGITVKWSKVTGASGYKIYRKTSGGSYSLIKTVTSGSTVSYTDTAVKSKNGTTYVYAVRPYSGSTLGSYTGKTTVRLTGVCISSLKNVKTRKMTVKWGKNSKATGYQIQYSTSSSFSSYKTVTVSSYKTVSKTISSLTKKKKYYVRVRAYKTVSGTKYYSAWSKTKNVKISK